MPLPRLLLSRLLLGAVLALLLLHALGWLSLPLLGQLDRYSEDARQRASATGQLPAQDVAIVAIDDASLASLGRWPWPRTRLLELLETLQTHYGTQRIGLDIVLAEAEESQLARLWPLLCERLGPRQCSEAEKDWAAEKDPDALFRSRAGRLQLVAGYYFTPDPQQQGVLPAPDWQGDAARLAPFVTAGGYGATHAGLAGALPHTGYLNPEIDDDGIVRRIPLLIAYRHSLYAALSARLASQQPVIPDWQSGQPWPDGVLLDGRLVHTDRHGRVRIPFYGPPGTIPTYSAAAIINRSLPTNTLKGKIIIVGATATGLQDIRATPVSPLFPGVEAQAATVLGLRTGTLPQAPQWGALFAVGWIVLAGGLLLWRLPRAGLLESHLWLLLGVSSLLGIVGWAWQNQRLLLPLVEPLAAMLLPYFGFVLAARLWEARQRRQLLRLFGEYVPPELVRRMQDDAQHFAMQPETRELTILFADLRDFTAVAEALPPEALAELVNGYLSAMTEEIHQRQGTIDKYIGDAVMAFWGAPLADTEHCRHAVDAALAMQRRVTQLNADFASRGWPVLNLGIGVHCGKVRVGNMGSEFRRAYTVMGDAVNVAARLEKLTRVYDVPLLVSGEVASRVTSNIPCLPIATTTVKGRQQTVALTLPLDERAPWLSAGEVLRWDELQQALQQNDTERAHALLDDLARQAPQRQLYHIYREQLATRPHRS
ncbi:adenylate/guanylate cyclase domain-containing protein [Chitinilyticum piscinae]|uniref:Adenylate/guanylate cyclase domain-containing protein n=1 Tax=Chitinilyticum piscinae TaxID=2866724 RepID=A0A8J7FX02_9NEIS|nr:adenylate/guanylate cyclase domain-containing protein [Chitinilyticum piscinae]MBE9608240.1 adenylate/guanylate cyclase domain-containing protein [Chitinilyticum piscinae]